VSIPQGEHSSFGRYRRGADPWGDVSVRGWRGDYRSIVTTSVGRRYCGLGIGQITCSSSVLALDRVRLVPSERPKVST